jgi:hypothetical protein
MARPSFADQIVAMGCLVHDLETYHTVSSFPEFLRMADAAADVQRTSQADVREYRIPGQRCDNLADRGPGCV